MRREDALRELARRKLQRNAFEEMRQQLLAEQYDRQQAFAMDPSRRKAVLGTRRAGKTSMWVRQCTAVALETPRCLVRIWAETRLRAKQYLWQEFKWLIARQKIELSGPPNETELSIRFANGSEIRLVGADKEGEVQKKRGEKTQMEVVIEAQRFGGLLRTIVDDVVGPSLFDTKGTLCLEGTPGTICSGLWYDITTGKAPGWSNHTLSLIHI